MWEPLKEEDRDPAYEYQIIGLFDWRYGLLQKEGWECVGEEPGPEIAVAIFEIRRKRTSSNL